ARDEMASMLDGHRLARSEHGSVAWHRFEHRLFVDVGTEEGERCGQHHELRAHRGGACDEALRRREVRAHVRNRAHLHDTGTQCSTIGHPRSGCVQTTLWRRTVAIAGRLTASSAETKLIEMPDAPARPVRPIRCT